MAETPVIEDYYSRSVLRDETIILGKDGNILKDEEVASGSFMEAISNDINSLLVTTQPKKGKQARSPDGVVDMAMFFEVFD